jgi:UDPglucose 6-dehydrogenase
VFSLPRAETLKETDIMFVCVGTPMWHTGDANLSQIESAVEMIAEHNPNAIAVIKSTVPPGTNAKLRQRFPEIRFISNPEFLRQGTAVADTLNPDRVVIGGHDPEAVAAITKLYEPLTKRGIPLVQTMPASAELIKYAANSLLGIKVAFINEIADLAETVGADVDEISHAIGLDPRIGDRFLKAGPGFGGSCFPKDTAALVATAERLGSPVTIVDAASRANRRRRESLAHRVVSVVGGRYQDARIGVLGLTFKAGTDDVRESPAVDLVNELVDNGVTVVAYDPAAAHDGSQIDGRVHIVDDPYEVARGADAVVVATEWPEFATLDLAKLAELMRGSDVVDLRNILDPEVVSAANLTIHPVGKPATMAATD